MILVALGTACLGAGLGVMGVPAARKAFFGWMDDVNRWRQEQLLADAQTELIVANKRTDWQRERCTALQAEVDLLRKKNAALEEANQALAIGPAPSPYFTWIENRSGGTKTAEDLATLRGCLRGFVDEWKSRDRARQRMYVDWIWPDERERFLNAVEPLLKE